MGFNSGFKGLIGPLYTIIYLNIIGIVKKNRIYSPGVKYHYFLCNINQHDALFTLRLFRQPTSTCFGHICSLSSRGVLYIHNNWYELYIYSIPPDDGLQISPKHVEVGWRNKLNINIASIWFLLHRYIEMHSQKNIENYYFLLKISNIRQELIEFDTITLHKRKEFLAFLHWGNIKPRKNIFAACVSWKYSKSHLLL